MKPFYFNAKTGALALLLAYTFGLLLLNFLHYEIQTAGYPLQVDNSESVVLNEALRLKGGLGHLYKPLDSPPFLQVCYPPLYLWLAAKATPSSPGQLFLPGRLITFASSILIMIILAFIINRYSKSFFSVIAGLSLYVSSPLILHWSALIRVDLPGIFLMMLALALYLARPKRFAWLFIFPLLLGLFTKHTLIAFPAAIIADSLIARDKSALKSIGVFCLLGLTIFLVLSYLTDGLFYQHIVTYSILPWRPEILLNHARQFIGSHPYYPILLAFYFNPFTRPYRSFRLITLGLFFSLIEFCFSGRIGTVSNFQLSFFIFATIAIALSSFPLDRPRDLSAVWLLSVLIFAQLLHAAFFSNISPSALKKHFRLNIKHANQINSLIRKTKGEILTSDAQWALFNNKTFIFDSFAMSMLARKQLWDQSLIINRISEETFSLIILDFDPRYPSEHQKHQFTEEILTAIKKHYRFKTIIGGVGIFVPMSN